jgi:short-subunit dehydrogenase involved in D-alanine esterification of teichoic acids
MKIKDHTILITGGTSGIGKALAEALAPNNNVIITGRSAQKLEAARQHGLTAFACDLTQVQAVEALVVSLEQEFPQLDILINNAGIQYNYDLLEESNISNQIRHEIATNLSGTIHLTHLLLPLLSTKPSTIINVSSALGVVPKSDGLIYSVSKAGLRSFTIGLRKILRGQPIRVLEIIPPVTDTHMTSGRSEPKMPVDELVQLILRQWENGKQLIAPAKVKLLLQLNRFVPGLANRLIG